MSEDEIFEWVDERLEEINDRLEELDGKDFLYKSQDREYGKLRARRSLREEMKENFDVEGSR